MNRSNRKAGFWVVLGFGVIGIGAICIAQSVNKNAEPKSELAIDEQLKLAKAARQERIQEEWTGDEKPFLDIQREMDEAIAQDQSAKTLAADAKAALLEQVTAVRVVGPDAVEVDGAPPAFGADVSEVGDRRGRVPQRVGLQVL